MPLNDPVPSTAFDVLQRNIQDLDSALNNTSGTVTTRTGDVITPIPVLMQQAASAIANFGYVDKGTFAAGATLTAGNDILSDGTYYWRWSGTFPKVVSAGSSPTPSGVGAWLNIGDSTKWAELAASDSTQLVGGVEARALKRIDGIKNLFVSSGCVFDVSGFYAGANYGGGQFIYDPLTSRLQNNGVTIISPDAIEAWNGTKEDLATLQNFTSAGTGCFLRLNSDEIDVLCAGAVPDIEYGNDQSFAAIIKTSASKLVVSRKIYKGSSITTYTKDDFSFVGGGEVVSLPSLSDTRQFIFNGARQFVDGVTFNGNKDNTAVGTQTPVGSIVEMNGINPKWNARTKNAQGYALTINGKNPTILSHDDDNSQYAGIRINIAGGDWDYVNAGVITCRRVGPSNSGTSTRGIVFNNDGSSYVSKVNIAGYIGMGTDFLFDAEAGVETGAPFFGDVEFGFIKMIRTIDTGSSSQSTGKVENVRSFTVTGRCDIDIQVTAHQGLRVRQITDSYRIGEYKCNRVSQLPPNVPTEIGVLYCEDGALSTANAYLERSEASTQIKLKVGKVVNRSTLAQSSSKSVIEVQPVSGNRIYVGSYVDMTGTKTNVVSIGYREPNAVVLGEPNMPLQVSTSYEESITRQPRVAILNNSANAAGATSVGDIFYRGVPTPSGTIGQVTTTAGNIGSTAVLKAFGTIGA